MKYRYATGKVHAISLVFFALAATSCAQQAVQEVGEPAILVNSNDESREELRALVSRVLNGKPVTLADNTLTRNNRLTIERKAHKDMDGNRIMGVEMQMPHQFRLFKRGANCMLEYLKDGSHWPLKHSQCEVIP